MTDQQTADARKVAFKTELLVKQLGLATGAARSFAPRVHMIKAASRPGQPHRIQCIDGSWIEIDRTNRRVRTWGPGQTARDIAHGYAADESSSTPWQVEHLAKSATASAPGAPRRAKPVLSDDGLKEIANGWHKRGFADVEMDDSGVWVALDGGTRLYDIGTRVTIYGPVSDEAISALVGKSKDEWASRLHLFGTWTGADRAKVWLECQRRGVMLTEYEPSPDLIARWEAEQASTARGSGAALRSDDYDLTPASAGPVPPEVGGSTTEQEPEAPTESAMLDAGAALVRNAERARADLEALYARWAAEARTEEDRYRLRREEEALKTKLAIYERARELARAQGHSREDAIRAAYAEARAERGYEPENGLRR